MTYKDLKEALYHQATPERKKANEWFFKTGPGEYGEGDIFIGVSMPVVRAIVKQFKLMPLQEVAYALSSSVHEERMSGLLLLVDRYQKAKLSEEKKTLYNFYLQHVDAVNNWDLVDLSAPHVVGAYIFETGDHTLLYQWINDTNLWKRRIVLLATQYFIRKNILQPTLELVEQVLKDKHDLIHKASGWMLRELGKKDLALLENFLSKHYKRMPRTMLRYAIEKFDKERRQDYLKGRI